MKRTLLLVAAALLFSSIASSGNCSAQETTNVGQETAKAGAVERVQLFDSLESPAESANLSTAKVSKPTAAELRQARAMYRSQQREARIQRNLWMGYEPLRPNWNATPMTTSRYGPRTIYVPIYYYNR